MRLPLLFVLALPWPALAQEAPPAPPVEPAPAAAPAPPPVEAGPVVEPTAPVAPPVEPIAPVVEPIAPVVAPVPPIEADGWRVLSFSSDKRLPDGRPTMEACGWQRDVLVERIGASAGGAAQAALLEVPCARGQDGALVPGKTAIRLAQGAATPIRDEDVQLVIARNEKAVAACQKRDPAARGLLQVKWLIAPDGSTRDIAVLGGAIKSPGIRDCVIAEIKAWRFPMHAVVAGVPVDFAFGFDGPDSPLAGEPGAPRCKADEKPKADKDLAKGEIACVEVSARPCAQGEKPMAKEQLAPGQQACVDVDSDRGVPFLKGELTRFGDVQLTNIKSSFGVAIGVATIDDVYYAQLRPDVNIHYGPFSLGLGAPLRFEVADLSAIDVTNPNTVQEDVFVNAGRFRTEDWDQIEDFLRPLRYLTYGRKEDRLYIDLNRVHSVTLGHGQLVRRYTPNVDIDEDRLFAAVDGYTDIGGFELMAGPFPVPRVAGGLLFVKPLGAAFDDVLAKSWSIGVSYVTDLNAPTALESRLNPADQRVQLAVDATNQLLWTARNNPIGDLVQGVGIDTELKVLKIENVDIKTYADYSHLFFPGDSSAARAFTPFDGGGFTLGGLLRASFGKTPVRPIEEETEEVKAGQALREMKAGHALRFRLEARTFDPQYLPSYFNTLYEIDRLQYGNTDRALRATLPTKIGFLASQADQPWRAGVYSELSYAWVDVVGVTVVYEDATALGAPSSPVSARNFALHAETSGFGFLQLFATYHYRNFDDFGGIFTFNTDNEILYAGGRLELLPFLFINAAAQRSFRIGFGDDDLARQVDAKGLRFSSIGFENVWSGTFDVELGWQF